MTANEVVDLSSLGITGKYLNLCNWSLGSIIWTVHPLIPIDGNVFVVNTVS